MAGIDSGEMALIAAHAWDVRGAKAAGLKAGFVVRGRSFPARMIKPDGQGETLKELARCFAELPD